MALDRVTVDDDALISTDVDKLIKAISSRKSVEIGELVKETGIGRKNVEKWVHVLEDEGYVHIDYKFTQTYVSWAGEPMEEKKGSSSREERGQPEHVEAKTEEPVPLKEEPSEIPSSIYDDGEEPVTPFSELTPAEPEELFSTKEDEEHKVKKKVLEALDEEGLFEDLKKEEPKLILEEEPKLEVHEEVVEVKHEAPEIQVSERPIAIAEVKRKPEKRESPLKEKVGAYLDQINALRREIASLKKEKDEIYGSKYLKLESRVEADIVSITEKILEKEGRLLELKERLLELPDKVDEADKLQRAVEKIGREGRNTLEAVKQKVSSIVEDSLAAQDDINEKSASVKAELEKGRRKMLELEESVLSINAQESRIRNVITDLDKQISELNDQMKAALSSLEETTEMKVEIGEMADQLHVAVERREKQLDELNSELEEIKKVENWVHEYVNDYEKKIEDIESYVSHSDDEMEKLKEAAEKEYIRKYLRELENVTKIYEGELEGIASAEKDVESRIADAKQRLASLIDESQQMIRKLQKESEGSEGYDFVLRGRKEQTGSIKKVIEEKEAEKERLSEDIDKAKKNKKRKK